MQSCRGRRETHVQSKDRPSLNNASSKRIGGIHSNPTSSKGMYVRGPCRPCRSCMAATSRGRPVPNLPKQASANKLYGRYGRC